MPGRTRSCKRIRCLNPSEMLWPSLGLLCCQYLWLHDSMIFWGPDLINLDHSDPGIRQGQEQQLLTFWEVVRDSQWVTGASSKKGPAILGSFSRLKSSPIAGWFRMEKPSITINGWFGGTLILGNLHLLGVSPLSPIRFTGQKSEAISGWNRWV